jgi:uroporphyrinogen decarboxylase
MQSMTRIERVTRVLDLKPVDRVPSSVFPWDTTLKRWISEGHVREGEDIHEHFDQDIRRKVGDLNTIANLDFEDIVLEETEETIVARDGNGAVLRRHKLHESTPEHIDYTVKDRPGWEEHIKPFFQDLDRRWIYPAFGPFRAAGCGL